MTQGTEQVSVKVELKGVFEWFSWLRVPQQPTVNSAHAEHKHIYF